MRRTALSALVVLVGAALVATTLCVQSNQGAFSQARSAGNVSHSMGSYVYYTLKDASGFVVARAAMGAQHQPVSAPQAVALLGDEFGLAASDSVSSMQLSPDGAYLAIDGSRDHGDQVWIYDVYRMVVDLVPAHVSGNFLHWLPSGHSFLYRPMFPMGPDALTNGSWNPGLWIVDAATGATRNRDIGVPAALLVDAAPSPDGTQMVYATTAGLGMGSDTWLMQSDGSAKVHLFSSAGGPRDIAGLFSWSPDGHSIAYERLADSSTPFLPAGVWIMDARGKGQHWLAHADGGHGYQLVWSPDSSKVAFVARTNPLDHLADMQEQALQSGIGVVDVASRYTWLAVSVTQTGMQWNINPVWSANSASITFTALNPINHILGGSPRYWSVQVSAMRVGAATPLTPTLAHIVAVS